MLTRCVWCGAWRWGADGRVLRRTAETPYCFRCDPDGRARWETRHHARLSPVREWLLAAPGWSDRLLVEARERYRRLCDAAGGPVDTRAVRYEGLPATLIRSLVPWADTLDLDTAANWIDVKSVGRGVGWPPVTRDAEERLLRSRVDWYDTDVIDIGAVFRQRGFPYPPAPHPPREPAPVATWSLDVSARLAHLDRIRLPDGRMGLPEGSTALPEGYPGALVLQLQTLALMPHSRHIESWSARGDIHRDDAGRVVVLWR